MITFDDFPPHMRLMLLTVRLPLTADDQAHCQSLIASGLDWDAFLAVTMHHRVNPVVYSALDRLRTEGCGSIRADVLASLHQSSTVNAFRAALSVTEYVRIADRFARHGFAVAMLKGVALSQQAFGNPGLRHVGDTDLLTSCDRLQQQIDLMSELGYDITIPDARLTPRRVRSFTRYWKDATFFEHQTESTMELHWRLFNNPRHPGNRVLDHARFEQISIFSRPVRVLQLQDQFLHQAAHGVSDAWIYLKSLADIAAYLRRFSANDLDETVDRASTLGLLPHVSAAIHLTNDWLGTDIRSAKLLPSSHPLGVAVRARTESFLLGHDFQPNRDDPSPADWLRLELQVLPGIRSKLEIAARILNRPTLWNRIDLNDRLFSLYPLIGALLPPRAHRPERELHQPSESA
jgi:hypothetical protein